MSCPGNDPLIDEESNHDINSVAGVLKLYFRGLQSPLFPKDRFNDLISCVRESSVLSLHTFSSFIVSICNNMNVSCCRDGKPVRESAVHPQDPAGRPEGDAGGYPLPVRLPQPVSTPLSQNQALSSNKLSLVLNLMMGVRGGARHSTPDEKRALVRDNKSELVSFLQPLK